MKRQPEPELMDIEAEAEAYAVANFSDVNQAFVDRLVELAGDGPHVVALDLGTGPGDIPIRLLRARPQWRVCAIDASFPMLRFGRSAAERPARPRFVLSDAKRLPFADATFDVVLSNSILHHINDVAPFWNEVRRIARPGGFVLLRDLFRPESEAAAHRIVETYSGRESALLKEEFFRSLLAAYTAEEVREQVQAAGLGALDVVRVTDRHMDIFGRLATTSSE
ncbi:MAG TPA: class I SAM-dependent methyltransferase [Candidatus Hydrogenedentes bacterium]|nr:class I SAM-dependent methyltransferase [Candidatus Hydrogenedentota bacterium]HPG67537.1 class I SAM-dependent methyltransferase [Candidatus Hydrogenedentota bacterium]